LNKNNFNIKKTKFFGWEPLLKKEEIKYVIDNFPKRHKTNFYITSNSTLIDDNFFNFVKTKNIKLTFSIDGGNKATSENRFLLNWDNLSSQIINNTKKYSKSIRINQVITSKNSKDFFKNFKFIYNLWVREFNFLPEYYREWTKEWLLNLKKWFDKILNFYNKWNTFKLVNLENYSDTSFFNLWIIIDTDWKIYWTNLILSGIFEKYKKELFIWNIYEWLIYNIENKEFIEDYINIIGIILKKEYSNNILKSVEYIDLILNNFCNEWNIKD
jgi:MoaA/NifB/PqqE/SkfB family radical SAM enzyme